MKLNPNDLLIFLMVTETRSLTATADKTGLTKSAISQALTRLETQIGARLLFRTTRSISLTEQGARLIPSCRALRQAQQDVVEVLAQSSDNFQETLVITAPHAISQSLLVPVLSDILRKRNIRLRLLTEDGTTNLVEQQVDLAIRVGTVDLQSAYISRIGTLHESIFTSPAYMQSVGGPPQTLQDLADWTHVSNDWQGDPISYHTAEHGSLKVAPTIRCSSVRDVCAFLSQGLGVGLLPDVVAQEASGLLRLFPAATTPVHAVRQHGVKPSAALKDVIDTLRRALQAPAMGVTKADQLS